MTAAVGGASQSGVEGLMQSGTARTGAGGHRNRVQQSDETKSETGEAAQQSPTIETSSSEVPVNRSEKVSRHKHSKSESDEGDTSFEDTFDSIGQDGLKNQASGERRETWSPELAIANMAGNLPVQAKSDTAEKLPVNVQGAVRPASLLKQNSIVALMDAKSRLFTGSENKKVETATAQDAAPNPEKVPDQTADPIPATVNSRETHWNFDDKTITAAAQQVSALQNEGQAALHTLSPLRAPTSASVLEKNGETAANVVDGSPSKTQLQAVSAPEANAQGNPSFSSGDQAGADLQGKAAGDPAERKVAKADASTPIDQIFSAGPSSSQGAASGVTAQIRNGVLDALAGGATSGKATQAASSTAATDLQNRAPAPSPVLRTLDLTLSPPDLGSVRLHLSLKSNSLAIEAEASKASTAKILSDDRATLERGLKDAGYDLSSLKITDASASGSTSSNNNWQTNGSPFRDGDQARSSFGGRQDGDMQRRDGSTPDQAQRRPKDNNQQNSSTDLANGRQGNALYI